MLCEAKNAHKKKKAKRVPEPHPVIEDKNDDVVVAFRDEPMTEPIEELMPEPIEEPMPEPMPDPIEEPMPEPLRRRPRSEPFVNKNGVIVTEFRRMLLRMDGCSRCRNVAGCTRSCWAKLKIQ